MKTKMISLLLGSACLMSATAAPLGSAEITTVVNDVRIYRGSESAEAATVGVKVSGKDDLHTGRRSRAELTFPDKSITRIGANSIFSFSSGNRDMEIKQGSFLLQVPKDAGGATIRTATVTAAITGTTTMIEFQPGGWIKFITLEGTAKIKMNSDKAFVDVPAGKMIVMKIDDANIPAPIMINLQKLVKTSGLLGNDFNELSPEAMAFIKQIIEDQNQARDQGEVTPAGVINDGPTIRENGGRDPNPSSIPVDQKTRSRGIVYNDNIRGQ
jgi:hypothetical protein